MSQEWDGDRQQGKWQVLPPLFFPILVFSVDFMRFGSTVSTVSTASIQCLDNFKIQNQTVL